MIWNVTVTFLVVAVIVLLWRVWRLEASHRQIGRLWSAMEQEALWRTSADDERTPWSAHSALNTQVTHLARTLGYEWKRTEAKEGWEEKNPFGVGDMAAYRKAMADSIAPSLTVDDRISDNALWHAYGKNRRKADRRKPAPAKKDRKR